MVHVELDATGLWVEEVADECDVHG
jgi:hypothetical protein